MQLILFKQLPFMVCHLVTECNHTCTCLTCLTLIYRYNETPDPSTRLRRQRNATTFRQAQSPLLGAGSLIGKCPFSDVALVYKQLTAGAEE